jgi:hypothetical protein
MNESIFKGLLSVEVKALPIIAGTIATISLIIRNPFSEAVLIESIQAPASAPLLPEKTAPASSVDSVLNAQNKRSFFHPLTSIFKDFRIKEIRFAGLLAAEFPQPKKPSIEFNLASNSKVLIKTPFVHGENIQINAKEGSELIYDLPSPQASSDRVIPAHQEDLASFELKTAHWLLVKPKVLELYALIRYKIGDEPRSQVVPVTITVQPPVKSIVLGCVSGSCLGYVARQLNTGLAIDALPWGSMLMSLLGIIVMATILAIVLSRQESSKGFVTLEDFYGAFVVGVVIGYSGGEYFEKVIGSNAVSGQK